VTGYRLIAARRGPRLQRCRVLITGASSGIGLEAARRFAREGASVALLARSEPGLEDAVRRIEQDGGRARSFLADVADRPALEAAIAQAAEWLGGIDVVVPNAGMAGYGPFDELAPEDFDRTVAVTFRGAVDTVRAALPHLERSGGTIVATVSIASKVPVPLLSPYVAAKHALRGFLGSLRVELRHRRSKVRVCMVHPAPIDTPYYENATSATGRQPKPLRSTYWPESVAQALVECAVRPRAEVNVGSGAAALALTATLARPLSDLILATYGVWGSKTGRPAKQPGALWQPSGQGRVRGGHGSRPSLWTALRLRSLRVLRTERS
jgi:NAD(P)-dependent dehydrogenase (short-subunit alcohol dehydrogenase family)